MKRVYIALPILSIVLVSISGFVTILSPKADRNNLSNIPSWYAETVFVGSWILLNCACYHIHHKVSVNVPNLSRGSVFIDWNERGGLVCNFALKFDGGYSRDAPY